MESHKHSLWLVEDIWEALEKNLRMVSEVLCCHWSGGEANSQRMCVHFFRYVDVFS